MMEYKETQEKRQLLSVLVQITLDETPESVPDRIVVNRGFIIHKGENNFINMDLESTPDQGSIETFFVLCFLVEFV